MYFANSGQWTRRSDTAKLLFFSTPTKKQIRNNKKETDGMEGNPLFFVFERFFVCLCCSILTRLLPKSDANILSKETSRGKHMFLG